MKLRKTCLLYFLLKKRLLKKTGFLLLLLSIPVITFLFSHFATTEDSAFLYITLASREESELADELIESISESSDIILFSVAESPEAAMESVLSGENDCAWIFEEDLSDRFELISRGEDAVIVTSYEREDATFNKIAKEKIYSNIYHEIAYRIYMSYCIGEYPENATEEELKRAYEESAIEGKLVDIVYAEGGEMTVEDDNYLTSTLRGLLSCVMLLCALSATMYFLADERDGTFALFSVKKRYFILFGTNTAALSLVAVAVSAALYFSGSYTTFARESALLIMYIFALSGFCSLLGAVVSNAGAFCVTVPVISMAALVLSPVFFDFSNVRVLQIIFPSYHYLYASVGTGVPWALPVYTAVTLLLGFLVYEVSRKIKR